MAGRDANRVQADFPQLVADVIRQLRLTGTLGLLEFSDQITPVYIVAQRAGALDITTAVPAWGSADITDGYTLSPAANAIIADTGALAAGTYDIFASMSFNGNSGAFARIDLQHRNAANAVTLASLLILPTDTIDTRLSVMLPLIGYTIALNERLRVQITLSNLTGGVSATIGMRLRPTP